MRKRLKINENGRKTPKFDLDDISFITISPIIIGADRTFKLFLKHETLHVFKVRCLAEKKHPLIHYSEFCAF